MNEMMARYLEPRLFRLLLYSFLMRSDREGSTMIGTFSLLEGLFFTCDYHYACLLQMEGFI